MIDKLCWYPDGNCGVSPALCCNSEAADECAGLTALVMLLDSTSKMFNLQIVCMFSSSSDYSIISVLMHIVLLLMLRSVSLVI